MLFFGATNLEAQDAVGESWFRIVCSSRKTQEPVDLSTMSVEKVKTQRRDWLIEAETYLFHNLHKLVLAKGLNTGSLPGPQLLSICGIEVGSRNDRNGNLPLFEIGLTAEDDLGCETRAETAVTREAQLGEAFEHRALSAGLVADDHQLREADVFPDVAGE